jgi:hypothetical protein
MCTEMLHCWLLGQQLHPQLRFANWCTAPCQALEVLQRQYLSAVLVTRCCLLGSIVEVHAFCVDVLPLAFCGHRIHVMHRHNLVYACL